MTNQPNLPDFQPHEQTTCSTTFAGKPLLRSVERILRLHDERLRLNTRRIWKLEGCPRGDVAEDVQ